MWGKNKNNKNTEIRNNQNQVNKVDNNTNNNDYNWDAEVIHGNAATGEQVWVKREVRSGSPIDYETMKNNWEEMDREAEKLKRDYPGQVISAISYQDSGGNQVIRLTPEKELIFPVGVPIYDENGNKIVGMDNIRAEIARRREEWARWEREGKLTERVEIHHTDDGKTVRIKFRAAPKRLHPNEVNGEREWYINDAMEGRMNQLGISSKKPKMEEKERQNPTPVGMEVDNEPQSSSPSEGPTSTEPIIKMLTDDEIKVASKDEIRDLIKRLNEELEIREKGETTSSSFQNFSTQDLRKQSQKLENSLNNSQVSVPTSNNDDKGSNGGTIMAIVGMVSVLAIGGVVFLKIKFNRNRKK